MGKISEIFNFDNIGRKIKNLAKWSCWITILLIWIAAPIAFIGLVSDECAELCWMPLVGAIIGPVLVWVGSWTLYAFGEFVEDIRAIRNKEENVKRETEENKSQTNMDESKINLRKSTQCECGEMFYGMYCPVCGKKSGNQNVHVVNSTPQTPQSTSKKCACGERFYGEICPNCGRHA